MSDDWLWLFEVKSGSAHGRASAWLLYPRLYQCLRAFRSLRMLPLAFVPLGADDGKLVLIHDVQSYIYTTASPVAVAPASAGAHGCLLAL